MVFGRDLVGRIQVSFFLFDSLICIFLLQLRLEKIITLVQAVLNRRRAREKYEVEYRQNDINGSTFRPIMIILLIVQKSSNFNWKTLLQMKSNQLMPWIEEVKLIVVD